ncbi:MAG: hypothetical protein AAGF12_09300 [Myxococcota bacterium]
MHSLIRCLWLPLLGLAACVAVRSPSPSDPKITINTFPGPAGPEFVSQTLNDAWSPPNPSFGVFPGQSEIDVFNGTTGSSSVAGVQTTFDMPMCNRSSDCGCDTDDPDCCVNGVCVVPEYAVYEEWDTGFQYLGIVCTIEGHTRVPFHGVVIESNLMDYRTRARGPQQFTQIEIEDDAHVLDIDIGVDSVECTENGVTIRQIPDPGDSGAVQRGVTAVVNWLINGVQSLANALQRGLSSFTEAMLDLVTGVLAEDPAAVVVTGGHIRVRTIFDHTRHEVTGELAVNANIDGLKVGSVVRPWLVDVLDFLNIDVDDLAVLMFDFGALDPFLSRLGGNVTRQDLSDGVEELVIEIAEREIEQQIRSALDPVEVCDGVDNDNNGRIDDNCRSSMSGTLAEAITDGLPAGHLVCDVRTNAPEGADLEVLTTPDHGQAVWSACPSNLAVGVSQGPTYDPPQSDPRPRLPRDPDPSRWPGRDPLDRIPPLP